MLNVTGTFVQVDTEGVLVEGAPPIPIPTLDILIAEDDDNQIFPDHVTVKIPLTPDVLMAIQAALGPT